MTKEDLIEIINKAWDCNYIGSLKLEKRNCGYVVKIGMPNVDKPIIIQGDMPEEKFLKYFKEEVRGMNVDGFYLYQVNREIIDQPPQEAQSNC